MSEFTKKFIETLELNQEEGEGKKFDHFRPKKDLPVTQDFLERAYNPSTVIQNRLSESYRRETDELVCRMLEENVGIETTYHKRDDLEDLLHLFIFLHRGSVTGFDFFCRTPEVAALIHDSNRIFNPRMSEPGIGLYGSKILTVDCLCIAKTEKTEFPIVCTRPSGSALEIERAQEDEPSREYLYRWKVDQKFLLTGKIINDFDAFMKSQANLKVFARKSAHIAKINFPNLPDLVEVGHES